MDTRTGVPKYSFSAIVKDQAGTIGGITGTEGTTDIAIDAENEIVSIDRRDANGTRITAAGSIDIALASAGGKSIALRTVKVCDPVLGVEKTILVLASAPY
jgi:hypothetical protein